MPWYQCRVANSNGSVEEILKNASSEEALRREFLDGNQYLITFKEQAEGNLRSRTMRIDKAGVVDFTETLALLMESGLLLKDALEVARHVLISPGARSYVEHLSGQIARGEPFSEAIAKGGPAFPPVYPGLVRIGEKVGNLDKVFRQLSEYMKNRKKLREKIIGALSYPIMVLSVAIVGIIGILVFLLPRLKEMFGQMSGSGGGKDLESALSGSQALFTVLLAILAIPVLAVVVARILRSRVPAMRGPVDALLLKIPVLGGYLINSSLLSFLFAMETLVGSGIPVEDALKEAGPTLGNEALRAELERMHGNVVKGQQLSKACLDAKLWPERIGRWIAIGERTGHIDKVFAQVRHYYQTEVEKWTERFVALVEPALVLLLGALVLSLIASFVFPIFSIYGSIL